VTKNLILCCDGTANEFKRDRTNVVKLYYALARDTGQVTYYHPGVGTASDASEAMEIGCDAVLMNTAIAEARHPILMAHAMRHAVKAGRLAYLAGRMPKKRYADPSSPLAGLI